MLGLNRFSAVIMYWTNLVLPLRFAVNITLQRQLALSHFRKAIYVTGFAKRDLICAIINA